MDDNSKFDVVIIGAGVIGLAIAERLSYSYPNILIIEKEKKFGQHISSRNSEVTHSGIYYPTNSLKSKLCIKGNKLLYEFMKKYDLPFLNSGKLVVASNQSEEKILNKLLENAKKNNIEDVEIISAEKAKSIEPRVKCSSALWVPSSGVMDSHKVMQRLEYNFTLNNGLVVYNTKVNSISRHRQGYNVKTNTDDIVHTKILINATGLWGNHISNMLGIKTPKIYYCKGQYYKTNRYKNINCLIYPVPSEISLGIHTVTQLNGDVAFGPNAYYVDDIDYSIDESYKEYFLSHINKYLDIDEVDIRPDFCGICPKLQSKNGSFMDFYINNESDQNFINLIGIDSPGLTSSLAIAEYVESIII